MTICVVCVDQESGKYMAFAGANPGVFGIGYSPDEAVIAYLRDHDGLVVAEMDHKQASPSRERPAFATHLAGVAALETAAPATSGLNWEQALLAMKQGHKVARATWKDMTLHIGDHVPHYTLTTTTPGGNEIPKPFVCAQVDIAATDWMMVE